eukprot:scaffold146559_cov18-Tisochrysis_lutea.AAC.1
MLRTTRPHPQQISKFEALLSSGESLPLRRWTQTPSALHGLVFSNCSQYSHKRCMASPDSQVKLVSENIDGVGVYMILKYRCNIDLNH